MEDLVEVRLIQPVKSDVRKNSYGRIIKIYTTNAERIELCNVMAPDLICPDKRLHCQMVFHQFVYVGLCLNQELCLGQRGKAGAQRGGALVSSAWSSSGVGVAKEDVP